MNIDWHNVATIVATISIVGGIMIGLMKGFFMTTKGCQETQDKCQGQICKKIDDLKVDIKEDRTLANTHYAEIMRAIGELDGKLNA